MDHGHLWARSRLAVLASSRTLTAWTVSRNLRFVTTNASDAWTLLGDPSRRSILEVLSVEPSSVTDLARVLPISRPAVSQHLKLLKGAGVVTDRAEGTRRIYSVDADQLERFRVELDRFWGATLENFIRAGQPETPHRPTKTDSDSSHEDKP